MILVIASRFWFSLLPRFPILTKPASDRLADCKCAGVEGGKKRWIPALGLSNSQIVMDHCSAAAFHEPHSVKQSAALNFWFVLFQDKMNRDVIKENE
jgi:hypothetical protein